MRPTAQFPKKYDPHTHEPAIYAQWEKAGTFQLDQKALARGKKPYVIMLPPPNITGSLHMGHALQDTIMDILIRYHRMKGEPTLWQAGTDHAAIATNRVLEEQLKQEGLSRHQLGREKFLERSERWYSEVGSTIIEQMKRLGCSADWSRLRFTMDPSYVHAVQEAFVRYYERGYIYRGDRSVNWDPSTNTTVSDLEIEWKKEKTPFYTLRYGPFQIGTARPETKFGDKYLVMHPDDKRYKGYQEGDTFACEWINGPVTATIIKDTAIDPAFGSGVMTITPWHDATDFEIAKRHNLDMEQIIGLNGKLLPIAGEFAGMMIGEARPKIVKKLRAKGLLVNVDENYEHNLAHNERGGVIELQVMRQWFVKMDKLKEETIAVLESNRARFLPRRWKEHLLEWMRGVHDWTISRQIWLGQRIPVWWKPGTRGTEHEARNYVVAIEKPEGEWEPDPDVLDTWFSSAIWPLATLGWPKHTDDLKAFYPTSVLTTAPEILYLWVVRMIFSGLELLKGKEYGNRAASRRIPFRTVLVHPVVLDKEGRRMSKSLGTGVDPLDLIKRYGADATRFGLMYQMNYEGQALRFNEAAIRSARNFANKAWNIARLVNSLKPQENPTIADEWIKQRLAHVATEVRELLDELKIGEASHLLYEFIWHDVADWYVEILKVRGSTTVAKQVFATTLKLLHPFMPHITELLWSQLGHAGLLIVSTWPSIRHRRARRTSAAAALERFQDIVNSVRSTRTLLNIPAAAKAQLYLSKSKERHLYELYDALAMLCRVEVVPKAPPRAIVVPLSSGGSIALASEHITEESRKQARRHVLKEREAARSTLLRFEQTLANMSGKAPIPAIAAVRRRIAETKLQLAKLERNLKVLGYRAQVASHA